ncbi:hypothetical protein V8B55DRAFT_1387399 [Mucor lusitanicus]|uniref:C-type lectin domain-containing protein n=2 Tax=Mucor circinelloides f. lusitanicus TaxID=29924 RepID=A0A168L8U6_MUCCL|nr:hypothetical protein FB192DRAFT_1161480 [Mucor lusitanicus]OAD03240.1 hypothetical protein MUCCIDRAFT_110094 [Mucor lusitanicus CBS 277.49]
MIKSITTTATVLSLISSVLAAGQMLGTPEVWECDAPGTEGFFISENEVHFEHAAAACASSGGILADITNQNFLFATDMILNCVGENENAWIRSWDYNPTNPQVRDCLAIYVGFSGPGGGIDLECGDSRYALCVEPGRRHTNVGRVRNYGAYNATQTVTVTQTLVPQYGGVYNIPYTIPAGSNEAVTYYGSVSEIENVNATTVVSGEPFVYTIQTVLSNSGSIESLNPAPSTALGSDIQPTNFVYTFNEILPESAAGQSSSSVPATPSLL